MTMTPKDRIKEALDIDELLGILLETKEELGLYDDTVTVEEIQAYRKGFDLTSPGEARDFVLMIMKDLADQGRLVDPEEIIMDFGLIVDGDGDPFEKTVVVECNSGMLWFEADTTDHKECIRMMRYDIGFDPDNFNDEDAEEPSYMLIDVTARQADLLTNAEWIDTDRCLSVPSRGVIYSNEEIQEILKDDDAKVDAFGGNPFKSPGPGPRPSLQGAPAAAPRANRGPSPE